MLMLFAHNSDPPRRPHGPKAVLRTRSVGRSVGRPCNNRLSGWQLGNYESPSMFRERMRTERDRA